MHQLVNKRLSQNVQYHNGVATLRRPTTQPGFYLL